ncbi:hypothetical protein roselon_03014 [Roseibacterium elongatum DSM 19469]|uniref:Uncharacterized protein n=1 Tax=Roseicyclus elongatus DSM 19469 TaxID=1294273 RepID=W8RVH9_9RHOB|nr:hypothetical protein [Roseibacterium elongatum]AHM05293.1 hypothetical protein roselon_03014 [Roseibacterium elongatum DSM 19469]
MSLRPLFALPFLVLSAGSVAAHTPICACYDNGDGTVLCEGGFSDGSSTSGVRMVVYDAGGNVAIDAALDENSEFVFDKPGDTFRVLFDAGEGHQIEILSDDVY